MALLNAVTRTLHCNIAYFGPAGSGKTSNLRYLHQKLPPEMAASAWFAVAEPPLLGFYFTLPLQAPLAGADRLCLHLAAVPGQVFRDEGRRLLLRNADAVVFVADARVERFDANLEMLEVLDLVLRGHGTPAVPRVLQYNKLDLPEALTSQELDDALNPGGAPVLRASAAGGQGVFDTMKAAVRAVLTGLSQGRTQLRPLTMLKMPDEPERLFRLLRDPVLDQR